MDKFIEPTINTYKEKNTILASKHPKKASKLASIIILRKPNSCRNHLCNFNYI